jgi:hypothetical protein
MRKKGTEENNSSIGKLTTTTIAITVTTTRRNQVLNGVSSLFFRWVIWEGTSILRTAPDTEKKVHCEVVKKSHFTLQAYMFGIVYWFSGLLAG